MRTIFKLVLSCLLVVNLHFKSLAFLHFFPLNYLYFDFVNNVHFTVKVSYSKWKQVCKEKKTIMDVKLFTQLCLTSQIGLPAPYCIYFLPISVPTSFCHWRQSFPSISYFMWWLLFKEFHIQSLYTSSFFHVNKIL